MLRPANPSDIDSIVRLECAAYYEMPPTVLESHLPLMRQEWRQAIQNDKVLCLEDPASGTLIGALHIAEQDVVVPGSQRTLVSLMVHPERQRNGIGQDLLGRFLDACDKDGHVVGLKVDPSNRNAIHLYERTGFRTLDREHDGLLRMVRTPNVSAPENPEVLPA